MDTTARVEAVAAAIANGDIRIGTLDFETDPFKVDRVPNPFVVGLYNGSDYWSHWGDDCVERLLERLDKEPPTLWYAHNGGKFDFHFIIEHFIGEPIRIINRRITAAHIARKQVKHEFRDSYAILPVPLREFDKGEIDYEKLERKVRNRHRPEIEHYLKRDCTSLYLAILRFLEEFWEGKKIKLTMASAAMSALQRFHEFERLHHNCDANLRRYYFGGRNQCFETGELLPSRPGRDFKIYDVNSMYPSVMKNRSHPISNQFDIGASKITKHTFFATVTGTNYGALPMRKEDGSLDFTAEKGTFFASIHEIEAAEETGTFKIDKVIETVDSHKTTTFAAFIDHFYERRMFAKRNNDKARTTLYKLIMNGAYGKFAQDPSKFMDYTIELNRLPDGKNWTVAHEGPNYIIFEKPCDRVFDHNFFNVATGASITGAARAQLLRAIAGAERPVYCDTDSVICENLDLPLGDQLGQWKIEGRGDRLAIAGKKLYALAEDHQSATEHDLFRWHGRKLYCVKKASKGVRLSPRQLFEVANGREVEYANPVPNFQLRTMRNGNSKGGSAVFVRRKIRRAS